jgi:glycosyltransferase involved in cell wall biosynthesis
VTWITCAFLTIEIKGRSRMRVMYIMLGEADAAAERQDLLQINRLIQQGISMLPVVGPEQEICSALQEAGIGDHLCLEGGIPALEETRSFWARLASEYRSGRTRFAAQGRLLQMGRERAVDLVLAGRPSSWVMAGRIAQRLHVPLVWRGEGRPFRPSRVISLKWISRLWPPDALFVSCEAVRLALAPLVKCPSYIIPSAVDTTRFDPRRFGSRSRSELGLEANAPVIGIVGRPHSEVSLALLADVLRRIIPQVPALRLLVARGDKVERDRYGAAAGRLGGYEELFADLGAQDRVLYLDSRSDLERLLASSDVVANPSSERWTEGCPSPLLEAMAMERPIVATRTGGVPEVIEHGVQGYLAPADDPAAHTRHLLELLLDPELRARVGAAGRAVVLERFSEVIVTRRLAGVLEWVVERAALRHVAGGSPQHEAPRSG